MIKIEAEKYPSRKSPLSRGVPVRAGCVLKTTKLKMTLFVHFCLLVLISSICILEAAEGYYKDLFMDGGVDLYSHTTLPAAESLAFSMEYLATDNNSIQSSVMILNGNDENGALLYPDGEPRFRVIYTNGGSATNHGNSLGETGRDRVRAFFYNGGSYTGSCAGAFICSIHYQTSGVWTAYYHIWPGRTASTGLTDTPTGHFITTGSPLLDYFDFGGDMYIANVYHNGGCYARETIDYPPETEVLLRFDYPGRTMHEKASCWAYKESDTTGRITVIGSHPEQEETGERLDLMKAILLYALSGTGTPTVKAALSKGETRYMNLATSDEDPEYTKIGDKQYHHFTVDVPTEASSLQVVLDGDDGYDLSLYLRRGDFAFESAAEYSDTRPGADKTLLVPVPTPGTWYIGVECATTVETIEQSWGFEYTGILDVLNGVAYSITADWSIGSTVAENHTKPEKLGLLTAYPNPFNERTTISFELTEPGDVKLEILDNLGKQVEILSDGYYEKGEHGITWDATDKASGVYFCRVSCGETNFLKKIILLK
ncbi:T9SS type A sorting domain-containing protein [bacterium]|nr:T9SS type A sorting domain-containing protein [bacterium]